MSDLTKETCTYGEICRVQNGCERCKLTKKDVDWAKGRIMGYTWEEIKEKQQMGGRRK